MKYLVCVLIALPLLCAAESRNAQASASARLNFTIVIPPVFRVLRTQDTPEGREVRVWTNLRSIVIDGREHNFGRVGENVVRLPRASAEANFIVMGL